MIRIAVVLALLILAVVLAAGMWGAASWSRDTRQLRARIDSAAVPVVSTRVDYRELDVLPPPVQRYLRAVLRDGQPVVTGVRLRHEGTFNMGETADRWRPFTSDQWVVTVRPGFDWDGRIRMMPILTVRVHDAYVAGEGLLHAALLGVVPVADLRGSGAFAEAELMRFLAEAVWYPTVLLPGQGVHWVPVDHHHARATLTDGAVSATLQFGFNEAGEIESVRAERRGRTVGRELVHTPWQGRFWNYQERGGMRIPIEGEVSWVLPEGSRPYWRGRITGADYQTAQRDPADT